MNLLLDTHALLWWSEADPRLSAFAKRIMAEPKTEIFVSAASAWEICTKARLGKLFGAEEMTGNFSRFLAARKLTPLAVTVAHAQLAGNLTGDRKDPFDRMLAAQAIVEDMPLVTADVAFKVFNVRTLW